MKSKEKEMKLIGRGGVKNKRKSCGNLTQSQSFLSKFVLICEDEGQVLPFSFHKFGD
jgi:hypothetical protein